MKIISKIKRTDGQATIELAVMFPIVLIIAVIAVNALTFFSECSAFDRCFKQMVTELAPNPGYGHGIQSTKAILEEELNKIFNKDFLSFDVSVENISGGYQSFVGKLIMRPTLFGLGLRTEIFGIPLPLLNHNQKICVEVYKPGVVF